MEALATKIRQADAFAFVVGEFNWGVQPSLKNLTDRFLEEWFWRPAVIASYSAGRTAGVRAALACAALSPKWAWSSCQVRSR
jgi:NAD(P)H-dependent FMN reductase